MPLVNLARDIVGDALIGGATYGRFTNAGAFLGVGDDTTVFAATQTDLVAGANKLRKAMDAGYPQRVANVVTWRATFGTAEAIWTWNERGLFNAVTGGQMLTRKVVALGAHGAGTSWQLTFTGTIVLV